MGSIEGIIPESEIINTGYPKQNSLVYSFFFCSLITLFFTLFYSDLYHWFIIPVFCCGVIIGMDAVDWFRGDINVFDPAGLLGLLGLHFFFMAPILHVAWNIWLQNVSYPADWRYWLGWMAIINFVGLFIYRMTRVGLKRRHKELRLKKTWEIDERKFIPIYVILLVISASLQIWVYTRFGGLGGYITSYVEGSGVFEGMGWIFMISESFPILCIIGFAYFGRKSKLMKSWLVIIPVLIVFIVLQMLFGGLRGSRGNTLYAMIWAIGIIHFIMRPIPKRVMIAGFLFFLAFLYIYGFYKSAGVEVARIIRNPEAIRELEEETGRTMQRVLLNDLARSDIQAFILYRMSSPGSDYEYGFGRSYVGDISVVVPTIILPFEVPSKVKEGTEIQYGEGSYNSDTLRSTRIYGLTGEAMLNFGPFIAPFAFALLGIIIYMLNRLLNGLSLLGTLDSRYFLFPFLVVVSLLFLSADLDNVIFFMVKDGLLPTLLIFICSKRTPWRTGAALS